jgi:AcrR family transcriptional regulator
LGEGAAEIAAGSEELMARLNRSAVIFAAIEMLEQSKGDSLTIPALAARLKIRPPSLYNHIESLSDLRRELAIRANHMLCEETRKAAVGKSRDKAVQAMAHALHRFAVKHPALYRLSVSVPPKSDKEWMKAFLEYRQLWFGVFESYDFRPGTRPFAARMFRSLVHGFVDIELSGGWLEEVDLKRSFESVLDTAIAGLKRYEDPPQKKLKN